MHLLNQVLFKQYQLLRDFQHTRFKFLKCLIRSQKTKDAGQKERKKTKMKILKRNQLIILVISLMLVTAGYLNFTNTTAKQRNVIADLRRRSTCK